MKKILALIAVVFTSLFLLTACNKKPKIQTGDRITISYDSFDVNGEVIEKNHEETFIIGLQQSFPIFETKLIGMKVGDKKEIYATSEQGYKTKHSNSKVQNINPSIFEKAGINPTIGEYISLGKLKGIVLEVTDNTIKVDFNEPYTHTNTTFKVNILKIEKE